MTWCDYAQKIGSFLQTLPSLLADIINDEAELLELKSNADKAEGRFKLALGLYKRALAEKHAAMPIDTVEKMQVLEGGSQEGQDIN